MSEIQPVPPLYPVMKSKKIDKAAYVAGQLQHKTKPAPADKDKLAAPQVDENA